MASKPILHVKKRGLAIHHGLNILRGRASFPATTSYVQLSKIHFYKNIIPCKQMFCHAKRRFTPSLLIGLHPAHSLRKEYSRLNLIDIDVHFLPFPHSISVVYGLFSLLTLMISPIMLMAISSVVSEPISNPIGE